MVPTGPGQLAGQRDRHCHDRHSVYRFRRERFLGAGLGAGNQRIFFQPAKPGRGQNPNAGPKTATAWLNPNAFQRITQDPNSPVQQFGSARRNIAQGPGYADWDFSLFKNIRVTESKQFQFRAEFFNLLNHTNFHNPDSDMNSQTFNRSSRPGRLMRLALRTSFWTEEEFGRSC